MADSVADKILKVMRNAAEENDISIINDIFGSFTNKPDNAKQRFLPGSTYTFCAKLDLDKKEELYKEAKEKGTAKIEKIEDFKPVFDDIYPLYWGKDKSLGSRIDAHLKNSEG